MDMRYLGDGVYATYDGYHVQLTVENGEEVLQEIFLDPSVIIELLRYFEDIKKQEEEVLNAQSN